MPHVNVFYGTRLAGVLSFDNHSGLSYRYDNDYVSSKGKQSLSRVLPVRTDRYSHAQCSAFFMWLLPDPVRRAKVLRSTSVHEADIFGILSELGGDTAGITIFSTEDTIDLDHAPTSERYVDLDEAGLNAAMDFPEDPEAAALPANVRTLLSGTRDKIAVRLHDGCIALPVDNFPSNYIIKSVPDHSPDAVYNEAGCMHLAERCGISVVQTIPAEAGGKDCLLVKRYDRKTTEDGTVTRLHQENFCQALGLPPEKKRQFDGGPSLPDCFTLLRSISAAPVIDLLKLYDMAIFNMLIGNHDAHGGKFSLIYDTQGRGRLAPFYDLYSHAFRAPGRQMSAMDIGGEYDASLTGPETASALAESAGLSSRMAVRRARELAEKVYDTAAHSPFDHATTLGVYDLIRARSSRFLERFPS